ncbi:hypothetical protein [Lacrimispora sp.]|uniref:hypothetical protein n=1 Tax=Lacrimispora sp. TaxID=2719234 RepID=UPI002857A074|nr:hypothetical protein [Lacrimispora sp.]MDR7810899.1 hypothetical protein [Lacrimispora sp.]
MMKKICPICDFPVNEANYCPRCRKLIRQPLLWNSEYYLNERRPANNSHDVHKPDGAGKPQNRNVQGAAGRKSPIERPVNPRQNVGRPSSKPAGSYNPSQPSRPGQEKGKKNSTVPVVISIALFALINILPRIIGTVNRAITDEKTSNYETAVPYDDSGFTELLEEDVKAIGESCNGYDHFPVDGRQVAASMGQFFNETNYGYEIEEGTVYSDNYQFEDEGGPISYYETVESFTFEDEATSQLDPGDENYVYQYVDINYDTATGELHDYISSLKDRENSLVFLGEFLRLVETGAGIPQEESSIPAIMEQAGTGEWQEDGAFITEGMFDINLYLTKDGVRIYVSYSNPQVMESQET